MPQFNLLVRFALIWASIGMGTLAAATPSWAASPSEPFKPHKTVITLPRAVVHDMLPLGAPVKEETGKRPITVPWLAAPANGDKGK